MQGTPPTPTGSGYVNFGEHTPPASPRQKAQVPASLTLIPYNTPGQVFRTSLPYQKAEVENRIKDFKSVGVTKVVVLVEKSEYEKQDINLIKLYKKNNFKVIHFEIRDFRTPQTKDLNRVVNRIYRDIQGGENVAIHCRGGMGRTGMVIATLANRALDKPAKDALAYVRQYVSRAAETGEQEDCIAQACREEAIKSEEPIEDAEFVHIPYEQNPRHDNHSDVIIEVRQPAVVPLPQRDIQKEEQPGFLTNLLRMCGFNC